MAAKKILFITQELTPYMPESDVARIGYLLPKILNESGKEVRSFMPRWGGINERRNQLHEVIRLSGINIIVNETDHQLVIKVASVPGTRLQVYFVDNDDFFHNRFVLCDKAGKEYADNVHRANFFARGVLETVKKLRWYPDIVHCNSWVSAITPLYVKTAYADDPSFKAAKVVCSLYNDYPILPPPADFLACLHYRSVTEKLLKSTGIDFSAPDAIGKLSVYFADGVTQAQPDAQPELFEWAKELGKPVLPCPAEEEWATAYGEFYDSLLA